MKTVRDKDGQLFVCIGVPDGHGENIVNMIDSVIKMVMAASDTSMQLDGESTYWAMHILGGLMPNETQVMDLVKKQEHP